MASTRSGYYAVKKEATAGTAVVPTHFVHVQEGDLGTELEVLVNNPIQATRWGAISAHAGKMKANGKLKMVADWKELGYWLGALVQFDAAPTANGDSTYTHIHNTANSLQSLTVEQGKGDITGTAYEVVRGFGTYVDSMELSGSDGFIMANVELKSMGIFQRSRLTANASAGASVKLYLESVEGLVVTTDNVRTSDSLTNEQDAIALITAGDPSITIATLGNSYTTANGAKVELVPQTPSFVAPCLFTFDMVDFQFGTDLTAAASATQENVEDWTFTYQNNLEERYGSLRRTPSVFAPKSAKATLKFKRYFEDRTDRDRYLNTTKRACIITIKDVNTTIGSGTRNPSLVIKISDLRYTAYNLPTGSDELYVAEVEGECFYDLSDARAVRMELTTTVASFAS